VVKTVGRLDVEGSGAVGNIINSIIMILVGLCIEVPEEHYNYMNNCLKTQNPAVIRKGYYEYLRRMRTRYSVFLSSSFIVIFVSWYYTICFCGIYSQSAIAWVLSGVISLVIDNCIVQVLLPLIVAFLRYLAVNKGIMPFLYKIAVKLGI